MASTGPVWEPASTTVPDRGRHRIHRKSRSVRGGSTVLGVAAIGAVAAGGVSGAHGHKDPSIPAGSTDTASRTSTATTATATRGAGGIQQIAHAGTRVHGQILAQAAQQEADALAAQKRAEAAARKAAAEKAAKARAAAAAKAAAEKAAREKAEKERAAREAARKKLLASWKLPVSNFYISAGFGQSGTHWANLHTGLDFAASTGTPVKSIGAGTIISAGWAGSYGYRIEVRHNDGTVSWYCHLSSITKASGSVVPGEQIGRVGATGNVTGPHLHLEIHPDGGAAIDPLPWLRAHGLKV